ncbi:hypothetical protein ACGFZK_03955 [Streptomyces sp. NPDC048257]|uniref:hypothetical protein n=1 Tax=Streptomyces sp. NPDC048257 TaxID=3365526 RepID=UPI0037244858
MTTRASEGHVTRRTVTVTPPGWADAWAGVGPMVVILAGVAGLVPATWSYHARTSPRRPRAGYCQP